CKTDFIGSYAEQVFSELNVERANWPHSLWVERLAKFDADINALHPFRDGNGRTQRIFFNQLVKGYDHYLDWTQASQEEMLHASIESFSGKLQSLERLIGKCLVRPPF